MPKSLEKYIPYLIGLIAFGYYIALCAKQWTFMFTGGDSGDWLAASIWWFAPQPPGSPLYISLGHLLNIFPGGLVLKMTVVLSCLPAAIAVSAVYLIVRKLTGRVDLALVSSGVLLACGVFLSQAAIVDHYAVAAMFVALAFWAFVNGRKYLTAVFLGLGSACNVFVVLISLFWFFLLWREKREWVRQIPVWFALGILPYGLILAMMALDTPRLLAGGLSLQGLNCYLGSTGTIGAISLVETPKRLAEAIALTVMSFGVALVPMWYGFKRPWSKAVQILIVTIGFCLWLYITDTDPTTWHFLPLCLPLAAVAVGIGLNRLGGIQKGLTVACVGVLLLANGFMLNGNDLALKYPFATGYERNLEQLPENAVVVVSEGGPYGLGLFYVAADGKDFAPLFLQGNDGLDRQGYLDYLKWMREKYGIEGSNVFEQVDWCISHGRDVYCVTSSLIPVWQPAFVVEPINKDVGKVVRTGGKLPDLGMVQYQPLKNYWDTVIEWVKGVR